MMEGKEIEKEYDGGAGKLIVDVDDKGGVILSNVYEKDLDGFAKIRSTTEIESNIFVLAEKIAAKTETTWDDKAIAGLKSLLGVK